MRIKRITGALVISLVFHFLIVSLISFRVFNQEDVPEQELTSLLFVKAEEPVRPIVRKPIISSLPDSEINRLAQFQVQTQPSSLSKLKGELPTQTTSGSTNTQQMHKILQVAPSTDLSTILQAQEQSLLAANAKLSAVNSKLESAGLVPVTPPSVVGKITLGNVEVPQLGLGPQEGRSIQLNCSVEGQYSGVVPRRVMKPVVAAQTSPHVLNPPNDAPYDAVYYKNHGTNPFIDTEDDNFSTFAMDVDTASYTVMRRYLRDGILPPRDAVRVEEFINSFDYNYDPPNEKAFAVHLEGAPSKFGEGKRLQLLRVGIQGHVIPDSNRKDAILTFVIDVSGSMKRENRLGLVKKALALLLEQLRQGDKIGIVVYGSDAHVLLPHTGIENREYILDAINRLTPDGSTNAEAGLKIGYKLALKNSRVDCINRVILCSDGVANVGQTGPDAILKEVSLYVKEGVTLTTVGFGMGNYNDILMEELANKGNGSYAYVDTISEAKRIFVENLTGTLQVIAEDAKIQVEFNPETVSRFRLLGYENRALAHEDFRKDDVDAGEVGSGHNVTALYEIKLHENANGKLATVFIRHENPDTQKVTEVNKTISTDQLKPSYEESTSEYQLAAAVAEFAEILRESYWAKEGSLTTVQETIEKVLPHLVSKTPEEQQRKEELLELVRKARKLKDQKEG